MEKGKKRMQSDGKTGASKTPSKKQRSTPNKEEEILSTIKEIMSNVEEKLPDKDLNDFLRKKIKDLKTEKRELVGIIGRIGSGKSSLINAVLEEKDLLPSGNSRACTAVVIRVEANMKNKDYEAEIEFISRKDAEDVLGNLKDTALAKDESPGSKSDATQQLLGLFGENWEQILSQTDFIKKKNFNEIPEFLTSGKKIVAYQSAGELSEELIKYTKTSRKGTRTMERAFLPLVKCVTVRVPNNDFLEHVTLVDLPGTGDINQTRDNMWKEIVGDCSTVWIAADIRRVVDEKDTWKILEHISSLIGNGGQCQRIHFICTMTDHTGLSDNPLAEILERNKEVKEDMMNDFSTKKELQNHFPKECFQVFTVSAKEFQRKQHLDPEDTEIPKLRGVLQSLNNCHPEILNYAHGAKGILSLIQGARAANVSGCEEEVCRELQEKLSSNQKIINSTMEKAYKALDSCLKEGVRNSLESCDKSLDSFLNVQDGSAFHKVLKCIAKNNGAYTARDGVNNNLNKTLASWLEKSIDEEFGKTFPNRPDKGPFRGSIKAFSLKIKELVKKFKDVTGMELRMQYLKTEEELMKVDLNSTIRDRKKLIYRSLEKAIEENMEPGYNNAYQCTGRGSLGNMKTIIQKHFDAQKNVIFEKAKEKMMLELRKLMDDINKTVGEDLNEAIEHSLKTNFESLPDVSQELDKVTEYYDQLIELQKEKQRTSQLRSPEGAGPSNA